MFDLFSLSVPAYFHRQMALSRPQYEANENKMIPDFHSIPFIPDNLHALSPYSKDLSDAIMICMHAEASRRPTPATLYEATRHFQDVRCAEKSATLPFSVRHRKLYYYGNEINHMSFEERNCLRDLTIFDWEDLHAAGNNDPNEPELDVCPAQFWNMRPEQDHQQRENEFNNHFSEGVQGDFHDLLFSNEERIRMGQDEIEILDPDDELTYKGKVDETFFLDEAERRRGKNGKGGEANDGGHSRSGDDNDNDNDGDHGDQGLGKRSDVPQPSKSAPRAGNEKIKPRRNQQGGQKPLLGGAVSAQSSVTKYTPYVPIDAHQERFENTADGKDLIFVIDTAPDPSLIPKDQPAAAPGRTQKRAADFFDVPSETTSSESNFDEVTTSGRYFTSSGKALGSARRRRLVEPQKDSKDSKTVKRPRRSARNVGGAALNRTGERLLF